ncbi:alanine racemase [Streptomyces silaceus]|uniref:alanine racemase n=1 Tax=Streptomyces silaceus TaxID=545123 RepID=UPI000B235CE9|nr:alanine racemase [Streptomyces silaceus]
MAPATYPHLRLDADALDRNIRTMADWCRAHDVALAPHVKTTMSAPVVERQLAAGAAGVTVATVDQAATVLGWGHATVLIANEVVDPYGLARLRALLAEGSDGPEDRQIRCFIDSAAGVVAAHQVFEGGAHGPTLEVLLDVGTPGGRTGVRDVRQARRLAELVRAAPGLRLVGVAGYEGVAPNTRDAGTIAAVDAHCRRVRDVYLDVAEFFETDRPVFSMGGSAFPDRVVAHLPAEADVPGTLRLLRSGCYVTHDHGVYARVGPVPGLVPALTVRAVVVSAPAEGSAVVSAGKRDLPYDAGVPVLVSAATAAGKRKPVGAAAVSALYDHHAVLSDAGHLAVTDVVEFGLSHPCSAFDRWPEYVVTDGSGEVVDVWRTDFSRPSVWEAAPSRGTAPSHDGAPSLAVS